MSAHTAVCWPASYPMYRTVIYHPPEWHRPNHCVNSLQLSVSACFSQHQWEKPCKCWLRSKHNWYLIVNTIKLIEYDKSYLEMEIWWIKFGLVLKSLFWVCRGNGELNLVCWEFCRCLKIHLVSLVIFYWVT